MPPIRAGIVGFGLAGRVFHAPFVVTHPRLRLTHVVQRRGTDAARMFADVTVVESLDELLAVRPPVELIIVATPNASHFSIARRALEARRHVVVEKPMSVTVQEANALVQLAQTAGTLLMPYHNRRWDGDFRTVRELLRRGWLGDVHEFESRFDRYRRELRVGAWREQPGPGAGLLFDLGPHLIDQALVLFGRPRAISATVRAEREGAQVDDHFELTLDYGDSRVRLGAGMLFDPPGPRFLISGTAGTYVKHGLDPQEAALRAGRMPGGAEWGQEPPDRSGELATTLEGLHIEARVRTLPGDYRGFYDNVCEVIEGRAAPAVTAEQGAQVVYCIHRAMESSARGGATITL